MLMHIAAAAAAARAADSRLPVAHHCARKLPQNELPAPVTSMMADAGVSIELRAKLTGHTTLAMNDRYTHLADATKRRAILNGFATRSNWQCQRKQRPQAPGV